jgi:hypothetical protein
MGQAGSATQSAHGVYGVVCRAPRPGISAGARPPQGGGDGDFAQLVALKGGLGEDSYSY